MEKLKNILKSGGYSCVVENFDRIFTFSQHGVADLYTIIKTKPCFLKEAIVADKIVGKAAAALITVGQASQVYADVISLSALMLLRNAGIETDFGRVVPYITNLQQSDWCPLERLCYSEETAEGILRLIDDFVSESQKVKLLEFEEV